MKLCIKTKHFITIRLKNPNENTTTLQSTNVFFVDIYSFFFIDINKKKRIYEKNKILQYMFTVYLLR